MLNENSIFAKKYILMCSGFMDLVDGCRKNDNTSQTKIFNELYPSMLRMCKRYCINEDEAEDCVIEGFRKVFYLIDKFNGKSEQSFKSWVKTIILRLCFSKHKKDSFKYKTIPIDSYEALVVKNNTTPSSNIEFEDLFKLVDTLPKSNKEIFKMNVVLGMSCDEISETTGKKPSTIRSQICKTKEMLRKKFNEVYI